MCDTSLKSVSSIKVHGRASRTGMESFWSTLKRTHKATFQKLSPNHFDRYVLEFDDNLNMLDLWALVQMSDDLAAEDRLNSGVRLE